MNTKFYLKPLILITLFSLSQFSHLHSAEKMSEKEVYELVSGKFKIVKEKIESNSYNEAQKILNEISTIAERHMELDFYKPFKSYVLYVEAVLYSKENNVVKIKEKLKKAGDILIKMGVEKMPKKSFEVIMNFYLEKKLYKEARDWLEEFVEKVKNIDDKLAKYEEFFEKFLKAKKYEIAKEIVDAKAKVWMDSGRDDRFERASGIYVGSNLTNIPDVFTVIRLAAMKFLDVGQYKIAEEMAKAAVKIWEDSGKSERFFRIVRIYIYLLTYFKFKVIDDNAKNYFYNEFCFYFNQLIDNATSKEAKKELAELIISQQIIVEEYDLIIIFIEKCLDKLENFVNSYEISKELIKEKTEELIKEKTALEEILKFLKEINNQTPDGRMILLELRKGKIEGKIKKLQEDIKQRNKAIENLRQSLGLASA